MYDFMREAKEVKADKPFWDWVDRGNSLSAWVSSCRIITQPDLNANNFHAVCSTGEKCHLNIKFAASTKATVTTLTNALRTLEGSMPIIRDGNSHNWTLLLALKMALTSFMSVSTVVLYG
jgi:hypothetical protein